MSTLSIQNVEANLPTDYVSRSDLLAKYLDIIGWPICFRSYYDDFQLWLVLEYIFRIPLAKSFLTQDELEQYSRTLDATFPLYNHTGMRFDPISREGRAREAIIRARNYRRFLAPISYKEYTTNDLRKAYTKLAYMVATNEQKQKALDEIDNKGKNIEFAEETGIIDSVTEKLKGPAKKVLNAGLYGAKKYIFAAGLISDFNEHQKIQLLKHSNKMCKILIKREDFDIDKTVDAYCYHMYAAYASQEKIIKDGSKKYEKK